MRLYKVSVRGSEAIKPRYVGSQAEAASARKVLNTIQKIPRDQIDTDEVDIPTDKKGLLAWLNAA